MKIYETVYTVTVDAAFTGIFNSGSPACLGPTHEATLTVIRRVTDEVTWVTTQSETYRVLKEIL